MGKLNKAKRDDLPPSDFAGPGRTYPIPDKAHARLALSGASHAEHVGNITPAEKAKIDAKAKRKLGETGSTFGKARDKQRAG